MGFWIKCWVNRIKIRLLKNKVWFFNDFLEPVEFICTFRADDKTYYGFRFYGEDDYYGEFLNDKNEWVLVYGNENYNYRWNPNYQKICLIKKPNKQLLKYLEDNAERYY